MQAMGLSKTVLSQTVQGYGSEYYSRSGRMFLRVEPTQQPYGYARRNAFRQPILEAQLHEGLNRYPNVSTAFKTSLTEFAQLDSRVRVTLVDTHMANRSCECDYLIGCDGASSAVRGCLGIELEGKSFNERWLILDLENTASPSRNTYVFSDAKRPCIALPGPNGTRRFEIKLHPREAADDMLRPDVVAQLLSRFGAIGDCVLARKCVYTFHARLADCWQSGRVFLAGDAAHLSPPFAGQGMNSGIRDAHNLAWKLAAVLDGRLGPELLASYEMERRDHVAQMIRLALRMGVIMAPPNVLVGWLVPAVFRALSVWPYVRDYFGQMKYKPEPRFSRGFLIPEMRKGKRALVGRLLQQPVVRTAEGSLVLFDEILGSGFALICLAVDLDQFMSFSRHPAWRRLAVRLIAVADNQSGPQGVQNVHVVVDESGRLLQSLARYRRQALLIRPDHYVAASFSLAGVAGAARAVERLVSSTWAHSE